MQFRLLGPVEIELNGALVPLARRRDRAVLAVLLNECGHLVTTDRLIYLLWEDEDPPAGARRTIQAHVARLRAALAPLDEATIEPMGVGYRLSADPESIDAHQARRSIAAARATDDLTQRAQLLRTAIDLWRGPTLSDSIVGRLSSTLCLELEELRQAATEEWYETVLALGQHREVAAELARLAAEHPEHGNLTRLAMLAAHRCGRVAEALAHFTRHRTELVDQIGLEPETGVIELQQAILRDDPALRLQAPQHVSEHPMVPNQLPLGVPHFVGRDEDLAALVQQLTPPSAKVPVVTISGMGGLGKTTLAVQAARDSLDRYPDGCLFVDLAGTQESQADPHRVLGTFLRAAGMPGPAIAQDADERLAQFRSYTSSRRLLVVLDNAGDERQVRSLLPTGPGCAAIITSRRHLSGLDTSLRLLPQLFSPDESSALIRVMAGEDLPESLDELIRFCGGLPLAVRIVAARLGGRRDLSPAVLASMLAEERSRLDELTVGDLEVNASLKLSYQRLQPRAATLLLRLGRLSRPDFSPWTCRVLLDDPLARHALDDLIEASLVTAAGSERYRLHDLVRLVTARLAVDHEPLPDYEFAFLRLLEAYLDTAFEAGRLVAYGRLPLYYRPSVKSPHVLPLEEREQALKWFRANAADLIAAVSGAADQGRHAEVWQLALCLKPLLRAEHMIDDWLATHEVALSSARSLGDHRAEAMIRASTGAAHQARGLWPQAKQEYQAALDLAIRIGDQTIEAYCHDHLGGALQELGDVHAARQAHLKALSLPAFGIDLQHAGWIRIHLSALAVKEGRFDIARDESLKALAAAEQFDDANLACFAHHNLSWAHFQLGELAEAERHARREEQIARRIGYRMREARGLDNLGDILIAAGREEEALAAWHTAVGIYEELGDHRAAPLRHRLSQ